MYRIAIGANIHPTDSVGIDVSDPGDYYSVQGLFDKDGEVAFDIVEHQLFEVTVIHVIHLHNWLPVSSREHVTDLVEDMLL